MIPEFSLFLFTLLGGAAAGAYIFAAFFPTKYSEGKMGAAFPGACLALLAVSAVALLMHLGHPERALNAFSNPGAGIAQEGFASVGFGLVVLADAVVLLAKGREVRGLRIAGGVLGALLTAAMANAYCQFVGTPVCAPLPTALLFVAGNLALGAAAYALFVEKPYENKAYFAASIAVEAVLAASIVLLIGHFAALGLDVAPLVAGLIVAPVAAIALMVAGHKASKAWASAAACVAVLVGLAIVRYAFYAAMAVSA